jgi:parallel beta-helix repeat protein
MPPPSAGGRFTVINFTAGSRHIVFDGFEVAHSPSSGIRAELAEHITIRNCVVHDVARNAISIGADNCLVEDNEVYNACLSSAGCNLWPGGWPQAVNTSRKPAVAPATVGSYAYNNVFRRNHVHDSWGEGIDAMFSDGVIIEDNVVHDTFSVGIYLDHSRNAVVRGNSVYTTDDVHGRGAERRPLTGILMSSEYLSSFIDHPPHAHLENIEVYNNVCVRVSTGIGQWLDRANLDNKNIYERIKIFHNTIDTKDGTGTAIRFEPDLPFSTQGNECKNNIFRASRSLRTEAGFVFENNLWVNGVPESGRHLASFTGDPGWLDAHASATMEGYRLKRDSLAAGKGQPIAGLTRDKTGHERGLPPDLGAWELEAKAPRVAAAATSALELLKPRAKPDFAVGINVLRNPSFEDSATPSAWESVGAVDAFRVVQPGFRGVTPAPGSARGHAIELGRAGEFSVAAVQNVNGIVDGRYGLQARVRRIGDGGSCAVEIETATGERLVCDVPVRGKLNHELADYDATDPGKAWLHVMISDIAVVGGKCTVRFRAAGGASARLLVDDVCLFRY